MAMTKDETVQHLIKIVTDKKEAIKKALQKPNWVTNCSFRYGSDTIGNSFNIQTINDVNVLVDALAFLIRLEGAHAEACTRLGVVGKFEWLGFSVEDWQGDFKTRIDKIQVKKNQEELETYDQALNKLISKEMREAMELEELTKKILG
jgi:hypothetical protein